MEGLMAAGRYGDVVDHAEAFSVVGESVMKSAADIDGDAVFERMLSGENRSARCQPKGAHQFRRERYLQFHFFPRTERAGLQLLDILRSVDEQHILIAREGGRDEVFR